MSNDVITVPKRSALKPSPDLLAAWLTRVNGRAATKRRARIAPPLDGHNDVGSDPGAAARTDGEVNGAI
jgi:hypothetical protein